MSREIALWWGAAAVLVIALSPVAPAVAGALWACPFREWTGWACPTCGTARAAMALAQLDVVGALTRYPLPTIGWLAFLGGGLGSASLALTGRTLPTMPDRLPAWARLAIVGAVLLNWSYSIATGV